MSQPLAIAEIKVSGELIGFSGPGRTHNEEEKKYPAKVLRFFNYSLSPANTDDIKTE